MIVEWNAFSPMLLLLHGSLGIGPDEIPFLIIPALLLGGVLFLILYWQSDHAAGDNEPAAKTRGRSRTE